MSQLNSAGRVIVVLAAMVFLSAACGTETELRSEPPVPPATAKPDSVEATLTPANDEPTAQPSVAHQGSEVTLSAPAPPLPVLREFDFDQVVWWPAAASGYLFMGTPLGVGRVNTDTGAFDQISTARDTDLYSSAVFMRAHGERLLVSVDETRLGANVLVAINPETFEVTGRLQGEGEYYLSLSQLDIISSPQGHLLLDSTTMTPTQLDLPTDHAMVPALIDDEVWTVALDGSLVVFDSTTGAELRRSTLPLLAGFARLNVARSTADDVWISFHGQARQLRINRRTLEIVDEIDFGELYGGASIIRLIAVGEWHMAWLVDASGDSWHVLGRYDYVDDELVDAYTVARGSGGHGWDAFVNPWWVEADGRLFVQDHRRRIVEVDVARLGKPSDQVWVDPEISRDPALSFAEQEVAQVVLANANDGATDRLTRPEAFSPETLSAIGAFADSFAGFHIASERIDGIGIDGDRAWTRTYPVDEGGQNLTDAQAGRVWVLRRVEGEWFIDSDWDCQFFGIFGFDCEPE